MDKEEVEEIAKIIKNIETDKDGKGVEITLDEILQGNLQKGSNKIYQNT